MSQYHSFSLYNEVLLYFLRFFPVVVVLPFSGLFITPKGFVFVPVKGWNDSVRLRILLQKHIFENTPDITQDLDEIEQIWTGSSRNSSKSSSCLVEVSIFRDEADHLYTKRNFILNIKIYYTLLVNVTAWTSHILLQLSVKIVS